MMQHDYLDHSTKTHNEPFHIQDQPSFGYISSKLAPTRAPSSLPHQQNGERRSLNASSGSTNGYGTSSSAASSSACGGGATAGGSPTRSSLALQSHHFRVRDDGGEGGHAGPSSVLLFGLSANPPTGQAGHARIVSFLASQGHWDEIWVMPVYKHMHAKNNLLIDFEHRFNMCRLNFPDPKQGRTRVLVMRLEKEVAEYYIELARQRGKGPETVKVGTIDVVVYAKKMMPSTSFSLTLGTDTFSDIKKGKWKRGKELMQQVACVIVSRPGVEYTFDDEEMADPRIRFYNVPSLSDISSTAVRKSTDLQLLRKSLEPRVLDYIRTHKLFAIGQSTKAGGGLVSSSIPWRLWWPCSWFASCSSSASGSNSSSRSRNCSQRGERLGYLLMAGMIILGGFVAYEKWGKQWLGEYQAQLNSTTNTRSSVLMPIDGDPENKVD